VSKLFLRYAAMNAGKSTQLLQVAHNYDERGMAVVLYTARLDDRVGVGCVGSRLGVTRPAQTYTAHTVFDVDTLGTPACVLVDEAQFLTEAQVRQLHRYAHEQRVPVICYSLRTDFRGNTFAGSAALLALADNLEEIKTICHCGRKATMNIRVGADGSRLRDGEQIEIGGNVRYQSVCGRCFYK